MAPATDFPIVGVGASAGAVEALEGFFADCLKSRVSPA